MHARPPKLEEATSAIALRALGGDNIPWIEKSYLFKALSLAIRAELRCRSKLAAVRATLKPLGPVGRYRHELRGWFPARLRQIVQWIQANRNCSRIVILPLTKTSPAAQPSAKPLVVCVSHVSPCPPRAGNEYRIQRLLHWLQSIGWDVLLVVCPLPGEDLTDTQITALAREYPNVVVVGRNGELRHQLARQSLTEVVASLSGVTVRNFAPLLHEVEAFDTSHLLPIIRTFCPDILLELLTVIDSRECPAVVQVNYCFMTRGFPLLGKSTLKIVDTHDVFSTKATKVVRFGIADTLALSHVDEHRLLQHADVLLAIQPDEAKVLRTIAPELTVLTVGVDMPPPSLPAKEAATGPIVLMVASANGMNTKGLRDFLRFAWPLVLRSVPEAHFHVVGSVGAVLSGHEHNVRWFGQVDDLTEAYAAARLIVNPAVAGTGLKIKTLEALAQLRPIVLWPSGVDGISPELQIYCHRATDWFQFAHSVIKILAEPHSCTSVVHARDKITELLSTDRAYAELREFLAAHVRSRGDG